jgi:hypothetical protein
MAGSTLISLDLIAATAVIAAAVWGGRWITTSPTDIDLRHDERFWDGLLV